MLIFWNECISVSFVFICIFVICKYSIMCTVWNVFCFCAQYIFLMYRMENILFLYKVHISDVLSGDCFVSVHSTSF